MDILLFTYDSSKTKLIYSCSQCYFQMKKVLRAVGLYFCPFIALMGVPAACGNFKPIRYYHVGPDVNMFWFLALSLLFQTHQIHILRFGLGMYICTEVVSVNCDQPNIWLSFHIYLGISKSYKAVKMKCLRETNGREYSSRRIMILWRNVNPIGVGFY